MPACKPQLLHCRIDHSAGYTTQMPACKPQLVINLYSEIIVILKEAGTRDMKSEKDLII